MRAYFDHNASMPLRPEARAAMLDVLDMAGNPSSVHREGRAVRQVIDRARAAVAALVNGDPARVTFTSGASEAAAWIAGPNWRMGRASLRIARYLVGATEHPCLLRGHHFEAADVTVLPVDASGLVNLEALSAHLASHDAAADPVLVAIQAANNETGVLQPLEEIARIVRAGRGLLVVDAVQAAGRIPLDIAAIGCDFMILSAHKIGGPKGVGAVIAAADLMMPQPLIPGGGQERGHRGGTENLSGIAGFGAAAEAALRDLPRMNELAARRIALEAQIAAAFPDVVIHGADAQRLPSTILFSVPGLKAETAQIAFDLAGVAISAGSACSSGKVGPSHVLAAMGQAGEGGLRLSFGLETSEAEFSLLRQALGEIAARRSDRRAA